MKRALLVAVLAAAVLPAPASALRFDPVLHRDPPDLDRSSLDVRGVAFGQRDLRMVLIVRTASPFATRRLGGARSLCLHLPRGRLCAVPGERGRAYLRWRPAEGAARFIPGVVSRPDGRTLRATFAPRALDLPLGPLRWTVEALSGRRLDRVPDRGSLRTRVAVLGQPYCFGAAARDAARPCRNPGLRRTVFPRPADAFVWDNAPCRRLPALRRGAFEPCEFGVTSAAERRGTFLLIGDSHAMHWRRPLEVVAEAKHWRGISVARPGCPFSAQIPRSPALGPGACARLHREAIGWLRARPDVETVFVSNWAPPGSSAIGGTGSYGGGSAAFGAMLDRLPPSVKKVYVLRDIPHTTLRAVDCVRARRRRGQSLVRACAIPRSGALVPDPGAAAASARRPRARAIDLTRFFCDPARCFPVVGGAYVYKDVDHMNAVFAASLGPFLLRALT